jgi:hypothetical protein
LEEPPLDDFFEDFAEELFAELAFERDALELDLELAFELRGGGSFLPALVAFFEVDDFLLLLAEDFFDDFFSDFFALLLREERDDFVALFELDSDFLRLLADERDFVD